MFQDPWWELYKTAVLEVDRNKLQACVQAAEAAMNARAALDGQVSFAERMALADARNALRVLKRERSDHLRDATEGKPRASLHDRPDGSA